MMKKRFWKTVEIAPTQGGYEIRLDTRKVLSPARRPCVLPNRAMADAMAAEWMAQKDHINPASMPITRLVFTAIDRVSPEIAVICRIIAEYGATDLLCYRAESPQSLRARQAAAWDPWLVWADQTLGASLRHATGVMHIDQDPAALAALAQAVEKHGIWDLTALYELVSLSGSLVLGLAVSHGALEPAKAWELSRIDENWNIEQWGEDAEAAAQAARRRDDFLTSARALALLYQD